MKRIHSTRRGVQVDLLVSHELRKIFATKAPYSQLPEVQARLNQLVDEGYEFAGSGGRFFPKAVFLKSSGNKLFIEAQWHDERADEYATEGLFEFYRGI